LYKLYTCHVSIRIILIDTIELAKKFAKKNFESYSANLVNLLKYS
jgi:hypothetical protein